MKCYKCKKELNGKKAYFKGQPICTSCWYRRLSTKRKVSAFYDKWIRGVI